jgi:hypothetical protein
MTNKPLLPTDVQSDVRLLGWQLSAAADASVDLAVARRKSEVGQLNALFHDQDPENPVADRDLERARQAFDTARDVAGETIQVISDRLAELLDGDDLTPELSAAINETYDRVADALAELNGL